MMAPRRFYSLSWRLRGSTPPIFVLPVALGVATTENREMLQPEHPLAELLRRDKRFHRDAYFFVFEALRFAQEQLGFGQPISGQSDDEEERHVTGQQLCEAIRRYAVQQYGLMAKSVLNEWGVRSTGDFGEMVFNLIEIGQMKKTDADRREDFNGVFDFDDGLQDVFQPIASDS
jgi:uncharacterized repeat protein (TIGR04138 family)